MSGCRCDTSISTYQMQQHPRSSKQMERLSVLEVNGPPGISRRWHSSRIFGCPVQRRKRGRLHRSSLHLISRFGRFAVLPGLFFIVLFALLLSFLTLPFFPLDDQSLLAAIFLGGLVASRRVVCSDKRQAACSPSLLTVALNALW